MDDLNERGPDGLLTPWAMASRVLADHGCPNAGPDNPQPCPTCIVGEAMGAEHRRAERAERDLARLGGPDPDAGLWVELSRLAGVEPDRCSSCGGAGGSSGPDGRDAALCPHCSGSGCEPCEDCSGEGCPACAATGHAHPDVPRAVVVGLLRRVVWMGERYRGALELAGQTVAALEKERDEARRSLEQVGDDRYRERCRRVECAQAAVGLLRWVRDGGNWDSRAGEPYPVDHACPQCRPSSDMLGDGSFVCAWHRAERIESACPAEPPRHDPEVQG